MLFAHHVFMSWSAPKNSQIILQIHIRSDEIPIKYSFVPFYVIRWWIQLFSRLHDTFQNKNRVGTGSLDEKNKLYSSYANRYGTANGKKCTKVIIWCCIHSKLHTKKMSITATKVLPFEWQKRYIKPSVMREKTNGKLKKNNIEMQLNKMETGFSFFLSLIPNII